VRLWALVKHLVKLLKSQLGAGVKLPTSGKVFLSVKNSDKPRAVKVQKTY
jgi:hypothetical protein